MFPENLKFGQLELWWSGGASDRSEPVRVLFSSGGPLKKHTSAAQIILIISGLNYPAGRTKKAARVREICIAFSGLRFLEGRHFFGS